MPTNSDVEFELNGTYEQFSALVGIDDEHNNQDSTVDFLVPGDGRELWRSGGMKRGDGAKAIKVNVRKVRRLLLRVVRQNEGGRIYADWVDAKLLKVTDMWRH